ncbi:MAG: hypothetical protein KF812_00260 [Fimbriimonadaceae bacterium]|nr:hypothetical protein [Fimbriimonadaceae bacterium]
MTDSAAEVFVGKVGIAGPGHAADLDILRQSPAPNEIVWATLLVRDAHQVEQFVCDELGFPRATMANLRGSRLRSGLVSTESRFGFMFAALDMNDRLETVAVFFDGQRLITVVRERVTLLEESFKVWLSDPDGLGRDIGTLLARLLSEMANDLEPVFEAFHERIEDFEEESLKLGGDNPGKALKERRTLLLLRRKIAPMRDNVRALARRKEMLGAQVIEQLRDLGDRMNHLVDEIDIGREMVREVVDAEMSMTSNRLNQIMRKMTVITSVLAVATLVASNYGMNFEVMPELAWIAGYPFAITLMLGLSGLTLWLFKRNGYF